MVNEMMVNNRLVFLLNIVKKYLARTLSQDGIYD